MIRINLLPGDMSQASVNPQNLGATSSSAESFAVGDDIKKDVFKKLVIILLGPLALFAYEQTNIPEINDQISVKQQRLSELQVYNEQAAASVAEIKKFKESEAQIESRIAALEKISQDRLREVKIMDLFQVITPERAWLTKLSIVADKLEVRGLALSDADVNAVLEALSKSVLVMDVKLVDSSQVEQDGVILKRFEISCALEKSDG